MLLHAVVSGVVRQAVVRHIVCLVFVLVSCLALVALSSAADFTASTVGDYGNVTVMEVSGNYDGELADGASNHIPRKIIANEFYQTHRDEYDFLVFFSNFDYRMLDEETQAFYTGVKNDTRGIGKELFDHSTFYGSNGKLQGTIDMGNLSGRVVHPLDPRFGETLNILNHELLHRWVASIKFRDNGNDSDALLGRDGSHWSYLLDSGASLEYGSRWRDNGDGTFTAIETRKRFSPLDLYLMGMIGKDDVPPMTLIVNPDIDPEKLPELGATISGTAKTMTIDDIIAVEGERLPRSDQAQKEFNIAFILLTRPGTMSMADVRAVENVRNGFLPSYSVLTDGQGLAKVTVKTPGSLPTNPGATDPNVTPRDLPFDLDQGKKWLLSRQQQDGSWIDTSPTAGRDTAEAVLAMQLFPEEQTASTNGLDWLATYAEVNTDYLARQIESFDAAGRDAELLVESLVARQNDDGGWGLEDGFTSNVADTGLALKALGIADYTNNAVIDRAVAYLQAQRNADGGWGSGINDVVTSVIQPTAYALLALNDYRDAYPLEDELTGATNWLLAKQNVDGGFGNSPSTVYDTAAAVQALAAAGIPGEITNRGVQYIVAQQGQDGSWNNSPYQTATALRASWLATAAPDLEISADNIEFIPTDITQLPTYAVLKATARNLGRADAGQVVVRLYLNGVSEETLVDEQVASFPAESEVVLTFPIEIIDGNDHTFTLVVDSSGAVNELDENNNIAIKTLQPQATYDFVIAADGVSLSTATVDQFQNVTATVTVTNAGTRDAYDVPLRFYLDNPTPVELAALYVDLPAGGTVSRELTWKASVPGEGMAFTVEVDPDNGTIENAEDNNIDSALLTVNEVVLTDANLSVPFSSVMIDPNPLVQNALVQLSAAVKNDGFASAGPFAVEFFRGNPDVGGQLLVTHDVAQLAIGESLILTSTTSAFTAPDEDWFYVRVDHDNTVVEISDEDNLAFIKAHVLSYADLSVTANLIDISPWVPREGDQVAIKVTVENRGDLDAENVIVDLSVDGQVFAPQSIALIEGRAQAIATFVYDSAGKAGVHEVAVVVDGADSIQEGNDDNNSATTSLNIRENELRLTEPYFSPNGDGVKDATTFNFSLGAPQTVEIVVVNDDGDIVRTFSGADFENVTDGSVEWDGLDQDGRVVDDGEYRLQVVAADGTGSQEAVVIVDNNNSLHLDSLDDIVINDLSCQLPMYDASEYNRLYTPNDDHYRHFVANHIWLPDGSGALYYRQNTYASNLNTRGNGFFILSPDGKKRENIIDDEFFHERGLIVESFSVSPDGRYISILGRIREYPGLIYRLTRSEVWIYDRHQAKLELLYSLKSVDSENEAQDVERKRYQITPENVSQLDKDNYGSYAFPYRDYNKDYRGAESYLKWSHDSQTLMFPLSWYEGTYNNKTGGSGQDIVAIDVESAAVSTVFSSVSGHEQDFVAGFLPSPYDENVVVFEERYLSGSLQTRVLLYDDPTDSTPRLLAQYGVDGKPSRFVSIGKRTNDGYTRPTQRYRTLWLDRNNIFLTYRYEGSLNHSSVLKINNDDEDSNEVYLSSHDGYRGQRVVISENKKTIVYKREYDLFVYDVEKGFERLIAAFGPQWVQEHYPGPSRARNLTNAIFFNISADGSRVIFGDKLIDFDYFSVEGNFVPREDYAVVDVETIDRINLNMKEVLGDKLGYVGAATIPYGNEFVLFSAETNLDFPIGDSYFTYILDVKTGEYKPISINYPAQLYGVPGSGNSGSSPYKGLFLFESTYEKTEDGNCIPQDFTNTSRTTLKTIESTANLTAKLFPAVTEAGVKLTGTATDRYFSGYKIEYATSSDLTNWYPIIPYNDMPVVKGEFTDWIPPGDGTYFVKLTAWDKAGNVASDRKRVSWTHGRASLSGFYKDTDIISPNGDNVLDEVTLHYQVHEPQQLDFAILDAAGVTIQSFIKTHASEGRESIVWDGRNEAGQPVADGVYTITVAGYKHYVTVDTIPPDVNLLFSSIDFKERYPVSLDGHSYDLSLKEWTLSYGTGDNPAEWTILDSGSSNLIETDRDGIPVALPPEDKTLWRYKQDGFEWLAGKKFKLSVLDRAGNSASTVSGYLDEFLRITSWDGAGVAGILTPSMINSDKEDYLIGGIETVRSPLNLTVQYRVDSVWIDAQSANLPGLSGFLEKWGDEGIDSDFNAVRIKGIDLNGKIHYSNVLTTKNIFRLETDCESGVSATNYIIDDLSNLKLQVLPVGSTDWIDYASFSTENGDTMPSERFPVDLPDETITNLLDYKLRMIAVSEEGKVYTSNSVFWPEFCPGEIDSLISYPVMDCGELSGIANLYSVFTGDDISPKSLDYTLIQPDEIKQLGSFDLSHQSPMIQIDTFDLSEGTYPIATRFIYADGKGITREKSTTVSLIVDRTAPTAEISYPVNSSEILCPTPMGEGEDIWYGLAVEGVATDEMLVDRYELYYGVGDNPGSWFPAQTRKMGEPKAISGEGFKQGLLGVWDVTELSGDIFTLKLKVIDVVGNVSCSYVSILIDRQVYTPEVSVDKEIFSPNGDGVLDTINLSIFLQEEATLSSIVQRVNVEGANQDGSSGSTEPPTDPGCSPKDPKCFPIEPKFQEPVIRTFQDSSASEGTVSYSDVRTISDGELYSAGSVAINWDGADDAGGKVPDGTYRIAVTSQDPCGNTASNADTVVVDSTVPTATISEPYPNALIDSSIVTIKGTAKDVHFRNYSVEVGPGVSPESWELLESSDSEIENQTLGVWNTAELSGLWTIRLTATDSAGNMSQRTVNVSFGQRAVLVKELSATPSVISPNNDGVLDSSFVRFALNENVVSEIEVFDQNNNSVVREIFAVTSENDQTFEWDGKRANGTIVPDGIYTVRLMATNAADQSVSQIETIPVTVDTTAPEINFSKPVNGEYLSVDSPVAFGSITDTRIENYSVKLAGTNGEKLLDSGDQSRTGYLFATFDNIADGNYSLIIDAADKIGNSINSEISFKVDTISPVVNMSSPQDGSIYSLKDSSINIQAVVGEANPSGYQISYSAGASSQSWVEITSGEIPADGQINQTLNVGSLSVSSDGSYSLKINVADELGHTAEVITVFYVDKQPPVIEISSLEDGQFIKEAFVINGSVSDDNLNNAVLEIGSGNCGGVVAWSPLTHVAQSVADTTLYDVSEMPPDGRYCLKLWANDSVENYSEVFVGFVIDTTAPETPTLAAHLNIDNSIDLNWVGADEPDLAGYNLFRNGVKINSQLLSTASYNDVPSAEGKYVYSLEAVDLAGNNSGLAETETFEINISPPTLQLTSPIADETVSNIVKIKGTAFSEDDFKEYRVYSGLGEVPSSWTLLRQSPVPVSFDVLAEWDTLGLAEDVYSIKIEAEDLVGNLAVQQITVTVDNGVPVAPTLLLPAVEASTINLEWIVDGTETVSGYILIRDGQVANASGVVDDFKPYLISELSYTDTMLPDGEYTYAVHAVDAAGNMSEPSNKETVTIETGAPTVTLSPNSSVTIYDQIEISYLANANDINSVHLQYREYHGSVWYDIPVQLSNEPNSLIFDPESLILKYGTYYVRAIAEDVFGNVGQPSNIRRIYFKPKAPENLKATISGKDIVVNWEFSTANTPNGFNVYRNGSRVGNMVPGDEFTDTGLDDGLYEYKVRAYGDGWSSGYSQILSVELDSPNLHSSYTPTLKQTVQLSGDNAVPGAQVKLKSGIGDGEQLGNTVADDNGGFVFSGISLAMGDNQFVATVEDDLDNVFVSDRITVVRASALAAPTGLQGTNSDYDVSLEWDLADVADQVFGYQVFRDGTKLAESELVGPFNYSDNMIYSDYRAFDNNIYSYAYARLRYDGPFWYEMSLAEKGLVNGLQIKWYDAQTSAKDFVVQVWNGANWLTLASVVDNTASEILVEFTSPYPTDKIRLELLKSNDTGYYQYIKMSEVDILTENSIRTTTYLDTSLADGTYSYAVRAIGMNGLFSDLSNEISVVVGDVVPPAVPTGFSGTATQSNVVLDWSLTPNTEGDLAGYNLYRHENEEWVKLNVALIDATTYTDHELLNGTHDYRLSAVDHVGNESELSSEVIVTVDVGSPSSPQDLVVTAPQEGGALLLGWSVGGENNTIFNIYRSAASGGPWEKVADVQASERTYVDGKLTNGTTYYYAMTSLDAVGNESPMSAVAFGTPADEIPPDAPEFVAPVSAGGQYVTKLKTVDLSGFAEPGVTVEIYRNGIFSSSAEALAEENIVVHGISFYAEQIAVSSDGENVAYIDQNDRLIVADLTSGESKTVASYVWEFSWSPDGKKLAFTKSDAYRNYYHVYYYDLDAEANVRARNQKWVEERYPSWSADGAQLVFSERYDGVFAMDLSTGTLTNLFNEYRCSWPKLSADGTKVTYFYNSRLYVRNLLTGQTVQIEYYTDSLSSAWSPDSTRVAYVRRNGSSYDITVYDVATGSKTQFSWTGVRKTSPAWSADGLSITYGEREGGQFSVVKVSDYQGNTTTIKENLNGLQCLNWRTSGEMQFIDRSNVYRIQPAGAFFAEGLPLSAGENVFYAYADDSVGNRSPMSGSITVVNDLSHLPDVDVPVEGLSVYPAEPLPGDTVISGVVIKNRTANPVNNAIVALYLWDSDDNFHLIEEVVVSDLPGFAEKKVNVTLNAGVAAGRNRIIVVADPDDDIDELLESNNYASFDFYTKANTGLVLNVSADSAQYTSFQDAEFDLNFQTSSSKDISFDVTIEDALGVVVKQLDSQSVSLISGTTSYSYNWNSGWTFAGIYRLHVEMHDSAGDSREAYANFTILPDQNFVLNAGSDKGSYKSNEQVTVSTTVKYEGWNALIPSLAVRVRIIDSGNDIIFTDEKVLSNIFPRTSSEITTNWNTGLTPPGSYELKIDTVVAGQILRSFSNSFIVEPTPQVTGGLFLESDIVPIGDDLAVSYILVNSGNADDVGEVKVTIIDPDRQSVVAEKIAATVVSKGETTAGEFVFQTVGMSLKSYRLMLTYEGVDGVKKIADTAYTVVDLVAPVMTIVEPLGSETYTGSVKIVASAADNASGVARVEYRLDEGEWQQLPFADISAGKYWAQWQPTLEDNGDHTVFCRATDGVGNMSQPVSVTFEVQMDTTPPVTIIETGTPQHHSAEGILYVAATTEFTLSATDDYSGVASTEYRIDGGDWAAYLPFNMAGLADGEHVIGYRSVDNLDNLEKEKILTVVVDNAPPMATVTTGTPQHSADGTLYVRGDTEFTLSATDNLSGVADTEYRLDGGAWGVYAPFTLETEGERVIDYRSTDHLGNTEDTHTLTVVVDNTPPETGVSFSNQSYLDGDVVLVSNDTEVTLSATDNLSGVAMTEYRIDDQGWLTYHNSFELSDLAPGVHTLTWRSSDNVENLEGDNLVTVTLVAVSVETEILNVPRVLVWSDDPATFTGKDKPAYDVGTINGLITEALGVDNVYSQMTFDKDEFQALFRSGIFNQVMILNQDVPFNTGFLRELRAAVDRGTGLLVSSWKNSVPPLLQDVFGIDFKGSMSMSVDQHDLQLYASPVSEEQHLSANGRILKTVLDGGILAGLVPADRQCSGIRGLTLHYPQSFTAGDQLSVTLAVPKGKRFQTVDTEELTLSTLPVVEINSSIGNVLGDIAISAVGADGVTLTLSAPYEYLEDDYRLTVVVNRADGSSSSETLTVTPTCEANLRNGMSLDGFTVEDVDADSQAMGEDIPAVVLNQYGQGKTAFFAYDVIASALNGDREVHLDVLRNAAGYLLGEASEPVAGAVVLLETTVTLDGASMELAATEQLDDNLTHLPLFDLTQPLNYRFTLDDGESYSYRYFVRLGDVSGELIKMTDIQLGLTDGDVGYGSYPYVLTIAESSAELVARLIAEVDSLAVEHADLRDRLLETKAALEQFPAVELLVETARDDLIHDIVQVLHKLGQFPDDFGLSEMLGEYLRMVSSSGYFAE